MAINLTVNKRAEGVKAKSLRLDGYLPAVVYGPKQAAISLSVESRAFRKALNEAGESTIIKLKGLDKEVEVLIQAVDFDAVKGSVNHADFYAVDQDRELTTGVALEFTGEAPVEKTGATVNKILHEVNVTCRPDALPNHLTISLDGLVDEESQIKISDLTIPEGVKIENDPADIVVSVTPPREEEPEIVPETEAGEEGEEGEGKEEGEEGASDDTEPTDAKPE